MRLSRPGRSTLLGTAAITGLVAVWWLLTATVVAPLYFPSPLSVVEVFVERPAAMLEHVVVTSGRVLAGLGIGAVFGFVNAISMARNKLLAEMSYPIIELLRPIPPLALIPFFILWFGLGDIGKVLLIAAGTSMILLVTTAEAIRRVPPVYVQAARTLGASERFIYRTVVTPAIVPSVFSALRVAAAISFALAIAAEYMGAQSGLGFLIMQASRTLQTDQIVAGIILIGLVSLALDYLIRAIGGRLLAWAPQSET